MGTFGGPVSALNIGDDGSFSVSVVNNRWAETSQPDPFPAFCFFEDCYVAHSFQRQAGVRSDLRALVDGVSSQANWVSNSGLIAGMSENGELDPLLPGFPELRAVLWKNGHITNLGTLPEGGYESFANAVNSKGQVIGGALNTIRDPNSLGAPGYACWMPFRQSKRRFARKITLGHALEITRFSPDVQTELLRFCFTDRWNPSGQTAVYQLLV